MNQDHDIIIIGAPRSGTNMLRDVLTALPGFETWPCDEINLAWRHGNRALPSDELRCRSGDARGSRVHEVPVRQAAQGSRRG